jgi:ribonuclease BN (tRNA processing enzyme)
MPFEVTILGSGVIVPMVRRRATSLYVVTDDLAFLMDCGPSALQAMEDNGIAYHSARTVFFTHYHPDHTLGVGHLFSAMKNDSRLEGDYFLHFYGPEGLIEMIEGWKKLYPSVVPQGNRLILKELGEGLVFNQQDVEIRSKYASHGDIEALSYRVDYKGKSFIYTGDSAYSDDLVCISRGADVLISECSFPENLKTDTHMTPVDVARLADRAEVKSVILVHVYPEFKDIDPAERVRKYYGGNVETAYDGMTIKMV